VLKLAYTNAVFLALGLFLGMVGLLLLGRWLGKLRMARGADVVGAGALDAAVFALLGLMIAFSFSGATSRFDERRMLIVDEANDIGTAYLRVDLLPAAAQPPVRDLFRQYVDSRLQAYRKLPDLSAARAELARTSVLREQLWEQAVAGVHVQGAHPSAPMLLLPALNSMFDVATSRMMAGEKHPPAIVFAMLFGLALLASLLAGHAMSGSTNSPSRLHIVVFAAAISVTVGTIIELEFPRTGFVTVADFDRAIEEVRQGMK
jgi:hypothetical protein